MNITTRDFTQQDIEQITADGLNDEYIAQDSKIITAVDEHDNSAELYVKNEIIERLGILYLQNNITLEYSTVLERYCANLSQNAYYNDLERYPEKIIDVEYVEDKDGERTEIYRSVDTGRLYMRLLCNEPFARWMTCHRDARFQYTDDYEVRANIIFRHGGQTEKITYDDWNGSAAYSNTFNENFRKGNK